MNTDLKYKIKICKKIEQMIYVTWLNGNHSLAICFSNIFLCTIFTKDVSAGGARTTSICTVSSSTDMKLVSK